MRGTRAFGGVGGRKVKKYMTSMRNDVSGVGVLLEDSGTTLGQGVVELQGEFPSQRKLPKRKKSSRGWS